LLTIPSFALFGILAIWLGMNTHQSAYPR